MSDINQSKSLLAKLLATENITMQRSASASTAAFDIKNRVLILPVWQGISNDLEDMLVVHEVGHALDTPYDGWKKAVEKIAKDVYGDKANENVENAIRGFMNVVEDARIDKRQKRRYPGARRNFLIGYKELIDRDFFGTAKRDLNSFGFIDRMNMYFKGGFNLGIKFDNQEMPLIKKAEALETFADVIKLTEEIFRFCKERGEEQLQNQDTLRIGKGEAGENGDEDDFDTLILEEGDFDEDEAEEDDDNQNGKGSAQGEGDEEVETDSKPKVKSAGSEAGEYVPESETEKTWSRKQSEILATDGVQYNYIGVPKPIIKNVVHDYKQVLKENREWYAKNMDAPWITAVREEATKFRTEDNATISYMVKEFEMKKSADIFSRISIAKTGVLDTNKIHSYKYNEDLFRRQSIVPTGKNHGFVMFLDWSGSMHGNIRDTVKQLISLTAFCKRVQIPFEVYTFRDRRYSELGECFDYKKNDLLLDNLALRNVLSSRMKSSELLEAYTMLWSLARYASPHDQMGGTPLNAAIAAADEVVKKFRASSKAQIVNVVFLTDGDSNWTRGIHDATISKWDVNGKRIKNKFVLQDKETGRDYYFTGNNNMPETKEITVTLLKRLKDRTGCNLIGFFLYDYSAFNSVFRQFFGYSAVDGKFQETLKKSWSENKFIPVMNQGYDEYYVLNTKAMADTENNLQVNSDMTKARIAKEFMKFSEKKSVNRVLLKRFIEKVA
jgi:hypothetical protein